MRSEEAVGVVIPMFNSVTTINDTLSSVTSQTYRNLDIVVVDDGSTDDSAAVVRDWQGRDERVRLISQANGGVAAARNAGAYATSANRLAFVDADDLWAPGKIEAQVAVMERSPEIGLVWCWFIHIDETNKTAQPMQQFSGQGNLFRPLCRWNIVGNGSSMLSTRTVFENVGGFNTDLRAKGAQGCEDYLFAVSAAKRFSCTVVDRHLVGYRVGASTMSGNQVTMWNSLNLVLQDLAKTNPEMTAELMSHRLRALFYFIEQAVASGNISNAVFLMRTLRGFDHKAFLRAIPWATRGIVKPFLRSRFELGLKRSSVWTDNLYEEAAW
jgi:glycosyltransferase involved in cell wall biosynthesis